MYVSASFFSFSRSVSLLFHDYDLPHTSKFTFYIYKFKHAAQAERGSLSAKPETPGERIWSDYAAVRVHFWFNQLWPWDAGFRSTNTAVSLVCGQGQFFEKGDHCGLGRFLQKCMSLSTISSYLQNPNVNQHSFGYKWQKLKMTYTQKGNLLPLRE